MQVNSVSPLEAIIERKIRGHRAQTGTIPAPYVAKTYCIQALSDIASSLVVGCPRVLEFIQLVDMVRVIPPYAVAQEVLTWRVVRGCVRSSAISG